MTLTQARRLVPFASDEPASPNAYLALTGGLGVALWGVTAYLTWVVEPTDVSLTGTIAGLVLLWGVVWAGRGLVAATTLDRAVALSKPAVVWAAVTVPAFAATVYGLTLGPTTLALTLFWAPWTAAYAVGYLLTGLLVDRGGVYLLAGAGSLAVLLVGLNASVDGVFLALAALHGAPLLVDAYRGGRQLDENGLPVLRSTTAATDTAGGRVPK